MSDWGMILWLSFLSIEWKYLSLKIYFDFWMNSNQFIKLQLGATSIFCWIGIYGKGLAEDKHEIKKCKMSWVLYCHLKNIGGIQLSNVIELIKVIDNVIIYFTQ